MFVLSVPEAPNTKTNSLCVQTIKLFLILILILCAATHLQSVNSAVQQKENRQLELKMHGFISQST